MKEQIVATQKLVWYIDANTLIHAFGEVLPCNLRNIKLLADIQGAELYKRPNGIYFFRYYSERTEDERDKS